MIRLAASPAIGGRGPRVRGFLEWRLVVTFRLEMGRGEVGWLERLLQCVLVFMLKKNNYNSFTILTLYITLYLTLTLTLRCHFFLDPELANFANSRMWQHRHTLCTVLTLCSILLPEGSKGTKMAFSGSRHCNIEQKTALSS